MRRRLAATWLAAGLLAQALPARSAGEESWTSTITPHFTVRHASPWLSPGYVSSIERIQRLLAKEFWSLGNALQTEKIDFYLYRDRASYVAGRFHPPSWSAGVALSPARGAGPKVFATYEGVPAPVIAHELTHLFFGESFGREAGRRPPAWLNEGLAVMIEEESAAKPGGKAPRARRPAKPIPMRDFMAAGPGNDDPAARVGDWYSQAGSVVRFLHQAKTSFQFDHFCGDLAGGESEERALRFNYGFRDVADFERAWLKSLPRP